MALSDYDALFRFLHILAGILWIGLLYFFNLVNLPLLKIKLNKPYPADMAEKVTANISLKALFWFRWAAMFTLIFGLLLLEVQRQRFGGFGDYFFQNGWPGWFILVGIVLAVIMWFNVWFLIWPNQQKIIGNNKKVAGGVDDETKERLQAEVAKAMPVAVRASRFNTWASVPMLFGMVFGAHGGRAGMESLGNYGVELVALAVLLILMMYFANRKAKS